MTEISAMAGDAMENTVIVAGVAVINLMDFS